MDILRFKKIAAWIIAGLLTALFVNSGVNKFLHPEMMAQMHLANWQVIIAIGEITSAILFLFPKTNKIGTLLLSAYMGGAIIIHMTSNTSILMASAVLILVWVVAYLRNPELFKL
jgi:uncharacterized membrane protein YphA (DoxX/SURF4 family)